MSTLKAPLPQDAPPPQLAPHGKDPRRFAWAVAPMALVGLALAIGIGVVGWFGEGWLLQAVERGDMARVKLLLAANPRWVDANGPNNLPILSWAIRHDRVDMVRLFIERGAKRDTISDSLLDAVLKQDPHILGLLLDAGGDPNPPAIRMANDETVLHLAAYVNSKQMVEKLLDAGANPLARDIEGRLPRNRAHKSSIMDILKAAEKKALATQAGQR